MLAHETHLLVAEDLEENRFALRRMLKKSEFKGKFTFANDGIEAWQLLQDHPEKYTVALLDRMMPGMSGMDVLERMKGDSRFLHIPKIFQTAMAQIEDVSEGLSAGAYYYITKPYPIRKNFLSIIRLAIEEYQNISSIQDEVDKASDGAQGKESFDLQFESLEEARAATIQIAKACPDPVKATMGIFELLQNAVEHGNAAITYDEKTQLKKEGCWEEEVSRRLALPENVDKQVRVRFEPGDKETRIIISDEGAGFECVKYLRMDPERAFDNHGRGIAMAGIISFDRIEYQGSGSEVHAVIEQ